MSESAEVGRPTKYKPEYAEQAYKLCLLGHTDPELAQYFEVADSTISLWKVEHSEFSDAVKEGKDNADANVAKKLYHRAIGYEVQEMDIKVVGGSVIQTPVTKYYPPDATSAIFWLKNRQRNKWRDKTEQEHSGGVEISQITRKIVDSAK